MPKGKVHWGAPPTTKRQVLNQPTKTTRYEDGNWPGSMSSRETASVIGLDHERPGIDTPAAGHGEQPDRHGQSKADEVEAAQRRHPDLPGGTLSR